MLENIKTSCEFVAEHSKHVSIDSQKIDEFIKTIGNIKMEHWLSSSPFGLLELPVEIIINVLLIYESIDFSFWGEPKWTIDTKEGSLDGSIGLLYVLLQYVKENGTTDFSKVESTTLKGNVEIPLLEERISIMREISNIVNEKMNGNFYQYIKDITTDIELLDIIITNFPSFKDERVFHNRTIYMYKLAQLLTSDILHIREKKEHIKVDYSHLVGCPDYKIPQILRAMKILVYDEELSSLVDRKIELPINSDYEVEIRASVIAVINKIYSKLQGKYNCIDINDYIYMKKSDHTLSLKPYHLTRCTNY